MKIFLPLIIISIFSVSTAMAQDEDSLAVESAGDKVEQTIDEAIDFVESKGEFGIKAGLNFSTFNNADVSSIPTLRLVLTLACMVVTSGLRVLAERLSCCIPTWVLVQTSSMFPEIFLLKTMLST